MALYLTSLVQQNFSSGPINQAFNSIRWAHFIVSLILPTESFLVKNVLEGAKKGNNKITELRTILQRESQNS